jgi:transcriptional regulator with PAS, ATPase and Fis domain
VSPSGGARASRLGAPARVSRLAAVPAPAQATEALETPCEFGAFVTYDPATALVVRRLEAAARSQLRVLILGESGTGKELLAEQIHVASGRKGANTHNTGTIRARLILDLAVNAFSGT